MNIQTIKDLGPGEYFDSAGIAFFISVESTGWDNHYVVRMEEYRPPLTQLQIDKMKLEFPIYEVTEALATNPDPEMSDQMKLDDVMDYLRDCQDSCGNADFDQMRDVLKERVFTDA